jgi:hypothetical protein
MKLPKRLAEILKKRTASLDELRDGLEKSTIRLQSRLFEKIVEDIILELQLKDGVILDNSHNYRLISKLEKVYETFNIKIIETLLPQVNKGITEIVKVTNNYFKATLINNLPARFERILEGARVLTDLRVGLRMGKMIRGGNIMSMLKIDPAELKQLLSKAVTSQMDRKEFLKIIKENINGTDDKIGSLERQFQRYTYDTYQQYDRAYNAKLAEEFGYTYFVYQGGLIKDSRDFCAAHNNKVWSKEEAEEWDEWTPSKGDYPEGYEVKQKDIYSVPSYLGYPGYDPLTDAGGPRCRHILSFIPDDIAFEMRPELRK